MPKPLKIAVDIRDLRLAKTGTRTYLLELCNEFKKMESDDIRFYFIDTTLPVYTGNNKLLKLMAHARYQFWKQVALPLKAFFKGCDIVFCTDNVVPIIHLGYKTIPVFHDAFFFETPENYGKLWLWLYKKTAIPAARRSPFIITPSAWAKKQINHYTKIPNEKLVVVHEGPKNLEGETNEVNATDFLERLSLKPHSYILHAGSMFKRKNIPALIRVFKDIKESGGYPELKLVLAGPIPSTQIDSDYALLIEMIATAELQNVVVLTGYLTDGALGDLYKNAFVYIFPSINEGFGIPVLEAFKYKLPVLVANNTALPEVGGDAVLQFNPYDVADISAKLRSVLNDDVLRKELIDKGTKRLNLFSWHSTALQIVEVFKNAV